MRTGIIHLTGLAATLLFALTIIAWVDSQWRSTIVGFDKVNVYRRMSICENAIVVAHAEYSGNAKFVNAGWSYQRDDTPHSSARVDELFVRRWFGFGVARGTTVNIGTTNVVRISAIAIPLWAPAVISGAGAILYLRFLRKRKRHASAGGVESDDAAGSVDDGVSHTS